MQANTWNQSTCFGQISWRREAIIPQVSEADDRSIPTQGHFITQGELHGDKCGVQIITICLAEQCYPT